MAAAEFLAATDDRSLDGPSVVARFREQPAQNRRQDVPIPDGPA